MTVSFNFVNNFMDRSSFEGNSIIEFIRSISLSGVERFVQISLTGGFNISVMIDRSFTSWLGFSPVTGGISDLIVVIFENSVILAISDNDGFSHNKSINSFITRGSRFRSHIEEKVFFEELSQIVSPKKI